MVCSFQFKPLICWKGSADLKQGFRSQNGIQTLNLAKDLYLQKHFAIKPPWKRKQICKHFPQILSPSPGWYGSFCCSCYHDIWIPNRTAAFCYCCWEAPMWMYSVGKEKEICANGPLMSVCKMLVEDKAALLPLFLASGLDSSICLGRISHVHLLPLVLSLSTSENHLLLNLLHLSGR